MDQTHQNQVLFHEKGLDFDVSDPKEIVKIATNLDLRQPFGKELRTSEVGKAASKVAAFADVRHALLRKQRNFAEHPPNKNGAILELPHFYLVGVQQSCVVYAEGHAEHQQMQQL